MRRNSQKLFDLALIWWKFCLTFFQRMYNLYRVIIRNITFQKGNIYKCFTLKSFTKLVWSYLVYYSKLFLIKQFYLGNPVLLLSENLVLLKFNETSSRQYHLSRSLIAYKNLLKLNVVRSVSDFLSATFKVFVWELCWLDPTKWDFQTSTINER